MSLPCVEETVLLDSDVTTDEKSQRTARRVLQGI